VNNNRGMAWRTMILQWLSDRSNNELTQDILDTIDRLDLDEFQPIEPLLGLGVMRTHLGRHSESRIRLKSDRWATELQKTSKPTRRLWQVTKSEIEIHPME